MHPGDRSGHGGVRALAGILLAILVVSAPVAAVAPTAAAADGGATGGPATAPGSIPGTATADRQAGTAGVGNATCDDYARRLRNRIGAGDGSVHTFEVPDDCRLVVALVGPDSTDLDLYLAMDGRTPTKSDYDARSRLPGSGERVVLSAGQHTAEISVLVRSYDSGGAYTLLVTVPGANESDVVDAGSTAKRYPSVTYVPTKYSTTSPRGPDTRRTPLGGSVGVAKKLVGTAAKGALMGELGVRWDVDGSNSIEYFVGWITASLVPVVDAPADIRDCLVANTAMTMNALDCGGAVISTIGAIGTVGGALTSWSGAGAVVAVGSVSMDTAEDAGDAVSITTTFLTKTPSKAMEVGMQLAKTVDDVDGILAEVAPKIDDVALLDRARVGARLLKAGADEDTIRAISKADMADEVIAIAKTDGGLKALSELDPATIRAISKADAADEVVALSKTDEGMEALAKMEPRTLTKVLGEVDPATLDAVAKADAYDELAAVSKTDEGLKALSELEPETAGKVLGDLDADTAKAVAEVKRFDEAAHLVEAEHGADLLKSMDADGVGKFLKIDAGDADAFRVRLARVHSNGHMTADGIAEVAEDVRKLEDIGVKNLGDHITNIGHKNSLWAQNVRGGLYEYEVMAKYVDEGVEGVSVGDEDAISFIRRGIDFDELSAAQKDEILSEVSMPKKTAAEKKALLEKALKSGKLELDVVDQGDEFVYYEAKVGAITKADIQKKLIRLKAFAELKGYDDARMVLVSREAGTPGGKVPGTVKAVMEASDDASFVHFDDVPFSIRRQIRLER